MTPGLSGNDAGWYDWLVSDVSRLGESVGGRMYGVFNACVWRFILFLASGQVDGEQDSRCDPPKVLVPEILLFSFFPRKEGSDIIVGGGCR